MYHPKLLLVITMGNDIIKLKRAEEALRDANQFNIEIVSQAGEGIVVYDRNLCYVVWNQFMERLTGALAEDVIGRKALDLFPHLIEQGVDKLLKRALNGETITSSDTPFHSPFTNQKGWMIGTYAPHRNALGEIIGVIATVRDITERKRTEEVLRESEERYRTVVSYASDGIILQESTGKILTWNTTVEKVFGVKAAEALDHTSNLRNWRTIREDGSEFSGDDHPSIHTLMTGEPCKNVVMGVRNATTDQLSWISISTSPFFRGGEPKPYAVVISFLDITERKKAETALQESETRFKAQYQGSPAPTFTWQKQGTDFVLIDFNEAAKSITDGNVGEFVGRKASDLYADRPEILQDLLRCHEEKEVIKREIRSQNFVPGKLVGTTFASVPLDLVLVHLEDITERNQAEEMLRESEQLFSSLVQHSAIATFVVDPEHKVLYWNKACEELTGIRAEEVIGTSNHWQAFYAKHRPCLADVIIDNKTEIMDEFYEIHAKSKLIPKGLHSEGWYPGLGGKDRYILFDAAPIYGINGKLAASIETLQDITERKLAEEELRKTRNYLENLIDYANAPIIVWDTYFSITRFNHAFELLTGLKADEVLDEPLAILFPENSREESMVYIRRTLLGEHWDVVEIPFQMVLQVGRHHDPQIREFAFDVT